MEHVITVQPGPDMRIVVPGYGDMTEDVARELAEMKREDNARVAAKAAQRQAYLAREFGETTNLSFGEVVGQVDEGVYQHWIDRYGPKFWHDKSNRGWFLKQHPECRVKSKSARLTVRVNERPYRVTDRRSCANGTKEVTP